MTDNLAHSSESNTNPSGKGGSVGAHLWAFFAGCLSGIAFEQIFGGGILGMLLAYVSLLPLYLVALSGGRGPAITATAFGVIAVFLQTMAGAGIAITLLYAVLFAVPAMVIGRVALIQTNGAFINSSAILLTMLTLGAVLLLSGGVMLGLADIKLAEVAAKVAENYVSVMQQEAAPMNELELQQVAEVLANSLSGLIALSWLFIHGLNFAIAQWLVGQSGLAARPAPRLSEITLPGYLVPLVFVGVIASQMLDDNIARILNALSILLGAGFTLVGMAVLHAFIINFANKRGLSAGARNALVIVYYIVFTLAQLPLLLAFGLGLLDPWLKYRTKLAGAKA